MDTAATRRTTLLLALLAALPAAAVPYDPNRPDPRGDRLAYEIELGAELSDNRAHSATKHDAGLDLVPRARLWWFHHAGRLEARALGDLRHYERIGSDYSRDMQLRLAAVADWSLVPKRLYWTFQDVADVAPIDPLAADSPDNRQQVNTFVTGPKWVISPGGLWSGELDARAASTWAEHSREFDNDRLSAAAHLNFTPRPWRAFSLGAESSHTDYRDAPPDQFDYDRLDTTIRMRNALRRLTIELTAGHSTIDFDNGERLTGPLGKLFVSWALTPEQTLIARVAREFSDAADQLVEDIRDFETLREDRGNPEIRPDMYKGRSAELQWRGEVRRVEWALTPYARDYDYPFEDQYDTEPLSHEARGVDLRGAFRLNSIHTLRAEIGEERRDYDIGRHDRDRRISLELERVVNSRWSFKVGVHHYGRDSDGPRGANYDENVISVALVFKGGR